MANLDINTIMLLLIAVLNFGGIVMSVLGRKEVLAKVEKQGMAMNELAINTNSIKDALVASTAKASFSEGADVARTAAEAEAKLILAQSTPAKVDIAKQSIPLEVEVVPSEEKK